MFRAPTVLSFPTFLVNPYNRSYPDYISGDAPHDQSGIGLAGSRRGVQTTLSDRSSTVVAGAPVALPVQRIIWATFAASVKNPVVVTSLMRLSETSWPPTTTSKNWT